jgi:ferritin-like metal-binding protein YciE
MSHMIFEDHPSPKKLSDQDNPNMVSYFLEELRSAYGIEKELLELLGRFQKEAFGEAFIKVLIKYSQLTDNNVERLEKIFVLADIPISSRHSPTLLGMTEEGRNAVDSHPPSLLKDLKFSSITAQFNFLNISKYTQLHSLAHRMQLSEVTTLFKENLEDEKKMCDNLSLCIIKEVVNKFSGLGDHR